MVFIIFIAFVSLMGLLVLHEFGHFITAKKLGIPVEEFGVGYPPRLFGKKIGGTLYSINLLPFGAFVKIPDKELREKPGPQRALVLFAGILSFWIIAAILITLIFCLGAPFEITDQESGNLINPKVQIAQVLSNSPAFSAGFKIGDVILAAKTQDSQTKNINKVGEFQEFVAENLGKEIVLTISRGKQILEIKTVPRISPPEGQGALGVGLMRVAIKRYSFFPAIFQGVSTTFKLTYQIILGFAEVIKNIFAKKPTGAELMGPVGIMDIFVRAGNLGLVYFLQTLALISLHVAIVNALPVPSFDGGMLFFLAIEKISKKDLNKKVEEGINTAFLLLLIALMFLVTIKDISKIIR